MKLCLDKSYRGRSPPTSHKGIYFQSSMDFAQIRWRNNQIFKLITKAKSEHFSHTTEM